MKQCLYHLLNVKGSIVTGKKGKEEVLNAFFFSVINIKASCPHDTQLLEQEVGDGEMSEAPTVQEEMVSVLLCQLDMHKSMCPDGIHPTGIRELVKEPNHSQLSTSSPG